MALPWPLVLCPTPLGLHDVPLSFPATRAGAGRVWSSPGWGEDGGERRSQDSSVEGDGSCRRDLLSCLRQRRLQTEALPVTRFHVYEQPPGQA